MKIARGILICGTGIGVSIAANKVPGAYAALVNNVYQAQRAQLSNNANIITLGAQVTGIELAKCLVKEYLSVTFDPGSRSMPKVARITEYEKEGKSSELFRNKQKAVKWGCLLFLEGKSN